MRSAGTCPTSPLTAALRPPPRIRPSRPCSSSTGKLSALLFLYREVLGVDLPYVDGMERAKRPARVPTVLTREGVRRVLSRLPGTHHLMASLLYGSGLRLMECVRLRVKDVDFGYGQITVRGGKGEKDRRTILPGPLADPLKEQANALARRRDAARDAARAIEQGLEQLQQELRLRCWLDIGCDGTPPAERRQPMEPIHPSGEAADRTR